MLHRIAQSLLIYKRIVLPPVVLMVAFLVYHGITGWGIDGSTELLIDKNNPTFIHLKTTLAEFGSNDIITVGIQHRGSEGITDPSQYLYIESLTDRLKELLGVEEAISFTNVPHPPNSVPGAPTTATEGRVLAQALQASPIYAEELISKDGKTAGIIVILHKAFDKASTAQQTVDQIKQIVHELQDPSYKIHVAGLQVLFQSVPEYFRGDGLLFIILSLIAGAGLLWLFFGNSRVLIISVIMVVGNSLAVVGVISLSGRKLNVITMSLPSLLITLSLAVAVHLVSTYYEQLTQGLSRDVALINTIEKMFVPCLVTSMTTAAGFCSLAVSTMVPVVEFGLFSALGVMSAFVLCMISLPTCFDLFRVEPNALEHRLAAKALTRFLEWVVRVHQRYPRVILSVSVAALVLSGFGIARISVDSDVSTYMSKDSEIGRAEQFVRKQLSGTSALVVHVKELKPGQLRSRDTLQTLYKLERAIENDPRVADLIGNCVSLPDYLLALGWISDLSELSDQLPQSGLALARDRLRIINHDLSAMLIRIKLRTTSTSDVKQTIAVIQEKIDQVQNDSLQFQISGMPTLYTAIASQLTGEQQKSIGVAFVSICLIMTVVLRSLRAGILSMIPNLIPVAMTLGLMGWLDISLNTSTSMVAAVALGIAVDDTIHCVLRFRSERNAGLTPEEAAVQTIRTTGRAVVTTSVVLVFGMLVLASSTMTVVANFGMLMATTMVSALIGDLFLLPVLLKKFGSRIAP